MRDELLWSPDRQSLPALPISMFAAEAGRRAGKSFDDYDSLHAWSVEDPGAFWDLVWDFCDVIGEKGRSSDGGGARPCGRRGSFRMRG